MQPAAAGARFFLVDLLLRPAPAENLAIYVAAILIAASVAGLRPVRVARFEVEKVPNPTSATLPPLANVAVMTAFSVASTEALVRPV